MSPRVTTLPEAEVNKRERPQQRPLDSGSVRFGTNLATVILQMAQAGLGGIESFPFLEAPVTSQINDGLRVLGELGAIHDRKRHDQLRLTRTGRVLARLPVDPRLGRMLLEASRRGCLSEVLVLVAGLTVPDIRERPGEHQQAADEMHRRFWSPAGATEPGPSEGPRRHTAHTGTRKQAAPQSLEGGDFEALLNLWNYLRQRRRELSGNQFRKLFRAEYLHYVRYREWQDLVTQLREACRELDFKESSGAMPQVLTSMLAGLLGHVGARELEREKKTGQRRRPLVEYNGARGAKFAIQPGSSLAKNPPELVMAYELVETSRLWARTLAPIRIEWVEQVGRHVMTRTVSEPLWSSRSASVVATERLTLFGVPIVADRRTGYAQEHPEQAREIFIRQALVEAQWETSNKVVKANRFALKEAEELTDRMRRPDLLISDDDLYAFYDARIPSDVVSGATFDKFTRSADVSTLMLTPADLVTDPGRDQLFLGKRTFRRHSEHRHGHSKMGNRHAPYGQRSALQRTAAQRHERGNSHGRSQNEAEQG